MENRQKEDSTNSTILDVPHVDIRLKNIGAHVPFGNIKASFYGKHKFEYEYVKFG